MNGTCRFIGEEREFGDGTQRRKVRALEITFEDGFIGCVYVTKEEEFVKPGWWIVWHYEISQDGTKITLKNVKHASSVDFLDGKHHEVIDDWPLLA